VNLSQCCAGSFSCGITVACTDANIGIKTLWHSKLAGSRNIRMRVLQCAAVCCSALQRNAMYFLENFGRGIFSGKLTWCFQPSKGRNVSWISTPWDPRTQEILPSFTNEAERTMDVPWHEATRALLLVVNGVSYGSIRRGGDRCSLRHS